jgi:hypothetical protein
LTDENFRASPLLAVEQRPVSRSHLVSLCKLKVITFSSRLALNCKLMTILFTGFALHVQSYMF